MNTLKKAALAIGFSLLAMGAQAAPDAIENGNFFLPIVDGPWYHSGTTPTFSSGIDGHVALDLGDVIYQSVSLDWDTEYTFSFKASGNSPIAGTFEFYNDQDRVGTWVGSNLSAGVIEFGTGDNMFQLRTGTGSNPNGFSAHLLFDANEGPLTLDNISITTAVPEPESWAMLLVGLAAVGGLARRHKTVPATG